jgi:nucleoid DNA-binding protein
MEDTIIALLNNNLRVIIPDFGAFIIRQKQPRVIVFNEFLRYNDGILIDFIVKTEGIDREIAEQRVADFAEDGTKLLASGRELVIEGLGSLKKDSSGKISFIEAPEIIEIENNDEVEAVKIPLTAEKPGIPEIIEQEIPGKQEIRQIAEEKIPVKPKPKSKPKVKPKAKSKIAPSKGKSPSTGKPLKKSIPPVIPLQHIEPAPVELAPVFEIAAVEPEINVKSGIESWGAFESVASGPGISIAGSPVVPGPAVAAASTEPETAFETPPVQPGAATEVPDILAQEVRTPPAVSTNRILAWVIIILFVNAAILAWFILRKKTKGTIAGKAVPTLISDTLYDRLADSVRAAAMDSSIVYTEVPDEKGNITENALAPGSRYYIVAGCFRDEINADSLVSSLKLLGYKAEKFGKIGNLFAVSYASFDNKDKAVSELKNIREKVPSAWMTKF